MIPVQRGIKTADGNKKTLNIKIKYSITFRDRTGADHSVVLDFVLFSGMTKDMILSIERIFAEMTSLAKDVELRIRQSLRRSY